MSQNIVIKDNNINKMSHIYYNCWDFSISNEIGGSGTWYTNFEMIFKLWKQRDVRPHGIKYYFSNKLIDFPKQTFEILGCTFLWK